MDNDPHPHCPQGYNEAACDAFCTLEDHATRTEYDPQRAFRERMARSHERGERIKDSLAAKRVRKAINLKWNLG